MGKISWNLGYNYNMQYLVLTKAEISTTPSAIAPINAQNKEIGQNSTFFNIRHYYENRKNYHINDKSDWAPFLSDESTHTLSQTSQMKAVLTSTKIVTHPNSRFAAFSSIFLLTCSVT